VKLLFVLGSNFTKTRYNQVDILTALKNSREESTKPAFRIFHAMRGESCLAQYFTYNDLANSLRSQIVTLKNSAQQLDELPTDPPENDREICHNLTDESGSIQKLKVAFCDIKLSWLLLQAAPQRHSFYPIPQTASAIFPILPLGPTLLFKFLDITICDVQFL
jgi:hypothetical protein